jgi:hypothetical protein
MKIFMKYWMVALLMAMGVTEGMGQTIDWWTQYPLPKEPINVFISQDSGTAALTYNMKKSKEERDQYIDSVTQAGWLKHVPKVEGFQCNQISLQAVINNRDFGGNLLIWNKLLYEGYKGLYDANNNLLLNEIYAHTGTLANLGKDGMPMGSAGYLTTAVSHSQNYVISGNTLTWEDVNFIESETGQTHQKPGDGYLPKDCDEVAIGYYYTYDTPTTKNNLAGIKIAVYKIENGNGTLVAINPNIQIFIERDTIPPLVTLTRTLAPKTLQWRITDETFRKAWYTIDDGPQVPIDSTGTVNLTLTDQVQKITVTAEDWFRLKTEVTTYRNATGIDGVEYSPQITTYPNPFTDQITITNSGQIGQPVILMDMMGRVLYRTVMQGENLTLADPLLSALTTGTYILQVGDHKEKVVKIR